MCQSCDAVVVLKKIISGQTVLQQESPVPPHATDQYYDLAFFNVGMSVSANDFLCQETVLWSVVALCVV